MLEAKMAAYNRNKFESSINTPNKAWKTVNDKFWEGNERKIYSLKLRFENKMTILLKK